MSIRSIAACGILSFAAAAPTVAGGWSLSLGVGFVFGGGGDCGWGGPVVSIGTSWSSGYGGYCGPYGGYRPYYPSPYYGRPYYGRPYYGSGYCAPAYTAPAYCPPPYAGPVCAVPAAEARVQVAAAPRPVAPVAPAETNSQRGWRLLEADRPGAMAAFGRAVARSEGADAYLGYSICAASAGQDSRAEWAARMAMSKDAQVLARVPKGAGVRAAAGEALARYAQKTRGRGETAEFTVAILSKAAGDGAGAAASASRLVGGDAATARLVAAVGEVKAAPEQATQSQEAPRLSAAMPRVPDRRVVVDVKADGR